MNWCPKLLRIRGVMQHGRCTICAEFTEFRRKATTEEARKEIAAKHYAHLRD